MPERPRPENPFSTRYTRPGALPFLFGTDRVPAESLSDHSNLSDHSTLSGGSPCSDSSARIDRWTREVLQYPRSAIVGPHGTGKSTLLVHLRSRLEQHLGRVPEQVILRTGEPATPLWTQLRSEPRGGTLIVDGYEQLSWPDRVRLMSLTERRGIRLLVTAHRSPWLFHRLVHTGTSQRVARQLAILLLEDFPEQQEAMLRVFDQQWPVAQGNIRQLWATLYEHFEQQLPSPHAASRRE